MGSVITQFVRYAIVGLVTNFIGYSIFLLLMRVGIGHKQSMSILYLVSTGIGFLGMRNWVFKNKQNFYFTAVKFFTIYFIGYLVSIAVIMEFVDVCGYSSWFIQAGLILILPFYFFTALKWFVFTNPVSISNKVAV